MAARKNRTSDASEIVKRRYFAGHPERLAVLEEERANAEIARVLRALRSEAGLTQKQLAELIGTSQPNIARLEDAEYEGHSLAVIRRIATALGMRVELRFVPSDEAA